MKLGYFYTTDTFHSVTSKDITYKKANKYRINCQADKNKFDNYDYE